MKEEEFDKSQRDFWVNKTVYYDKEGIHDDNLYCLSFYGAAVEVPDLSIQEIARLHDVLGKVLEIEKEYRKLFDKFTETPNFEDE